MMLKDLVSLTEMNVCVRSKGALVVLAISILLTTATIITGCLSTNFIDNYSYAIFAAIGLHYLFYPLLGLLGEKWMRYKVILVGIILKFAGFFTVMLTLVILYFVHVNDIVAFSVCLDTMFPYFFGYGIFEGNVIQFGTDQLQSASSQELSSFVYWVLYMNYSLLAFILLLASSITSIVYKNTTYFIFTCVLVMVYLLSSLQFCLLLFQTSFGY